MRSSPQNWQRTHSETEPGESEASISGGDGRKGDGDFCGGCCGRSGFVSSGRVARDSTTGSGCCLGGFAFDADNTGGGGAIGCCGGARGRLPRVRRLPGFGFGVTVDDCIASARPSVCALSLSHKYSTVQVVRLKLYCTVHTRYRTCILTVAKGGKSPGWIFRLSIFPTELVVTSECCLTAKRKSRYRSLSPAAYICACVEDTRGPRETDHCIACTLFVYDLTDPKSSRRDDDTTTCSCRVLLCRSHSEVVLVSRRRARRVTRHFYYYSVMISFSCYMLLGILALARDTVSIQLRVNNKYGRKRNHSPQ